MADKSDLKVDYTLLEHSEKRLSKLKREFEKIGDRKDDLEETWGSGSISGAMGDFVDNWDYYRDKLIENLDSVGQLVSSARKGFRELDKGKQGGKG